MNYLNIILPGILIAATGVGAGDLITAGIAGSNIGLACLWAPIIGGVLKYVLNEGLTRWQMSTGTTLIEGWSDHFGSWFKWVFLSYLIIWSYMVGGALINACAVAANSFYIIHDFGTSKIIWGILHSIIAVLLIRFGNFKFFERIMSTLIAIMFASVIGSAILSKPDLSLLFKGIFLPTIPKGSIGWIIGIIGGVGGTLTILSYGYWIKEENRTGKTGLKVSRIDLAVSYTLTVLFSMAMIILGSALSGYDGDKAALPMLIANHISFVLNPQAGWIFLLGFWGGVFSSMLGVWQSVPYLFTDFMLIKNNQSKDVDFSKTKYYSYYMWGLAIVPMSSLFIKFESIQLAYAILGALFMPFLAGSLLYLNNKVKLVKLEYKNTFISNFFLVFTLLFFTFMGIKKIL